MTATTKEISAAVAAMQAATAGIIHQAILQKVPHIYAGQAEGLVSDIDNALWPIAAKVAIETTEVSRASAAPVANDAPASATATFNKPKVVVS